MSKKIHLNTAQRIFQRIKGLSLSICMTQALLLCCVFILSYTLIIQEEYIPLCPPLTHNLRSLCDVS